MIEATGFCLFRVFLGNYQPQCSPFTNQFVSAYTPLKIGVPSSIVYCTWVSICIRRGDCVSYLGTTLGFLYRARPLGVLPLLSPRCPMMEGVRRSSCIVRRSSVVVDLRSFVFLSSCVARVSSFVFVLRRPSFVARRASFVVPRSSFIVRRLSCVLRRSSFVARRVSFIVRRSSLVVRRSSLGSPFVRPRRRRGIR